MESIGIGDWVLVKREFGGDGTIWVVRGYRPGGKKIWLESRSGRRTIDKEGWRLVKVNTVLSALEDIKEEMGVDALDVVVEMVSELIERIGTGKNG